MTEASLYHPLPHIWADISTRVTVNLTLANSALSDMASPCHGVTVFAALSNSDVWDHGSDTTVKEFKLNSGLCIL